MPETASGEIDGKIRVVVRVRVSHVAAVQDHCAVEQTLRAIKRLGKFRQQIPQQAHLPSIDLFQLSYLLGNLTVMGQAVITVHRLGVLVNLKYTRFVCVQH